MRCVNADEIPSLLSENFSPWYVVQGSDSQCPLVVVDANNLQQVMQQYSLIDVIPFVPPALLGSQQFLRQQGASYPYVVGEMANGIASADMVIQAARAGLMTFFGSAGLPPSQIVTNIEKIRAQLDDSIRCWGANLIYNPSEPALEQATAELFIANGIQSVSASAYLELSPYLVHYACNGLKRLANGDIVRSHHVFAKISRVEVARLFMSPAPEDILQFLLKSNKLTEEEVECARHIPLAENITVEADSGGHTDNRPATVLFPVIKHVAQEVAAQHGFHHRYHLGLAGGIGCPEAVLAAFAMGASYVLTGTINETAVESGLSPFGRAMMQQASMTDVSMAAAADMFEMGVKLQVLKRGTLFSSRANKLYQIYKQFGSLDDLPDAIKKDLEKSIFHHSLEEIWKMTESFFTDRDPTQIEKAKRDPRHKMALVFRWYLGQSSRWAIHGESSRRSDYQIWCGPVIGAFNRWVDGSYLQDLEQRSVVDIAHNLLMGASILQRAQRLQQAGVDIDLLSIKASIRQYSRNKESS